MKLVPTLALVALALSRISDAQPTGGFWCWIHPGGEPGICGRERAACEAVREGFNRTAVDLGIEVIVTPCAWQQTAWERHPQHVAPPALRHFPNKPLCVRGLDRGESCRLVR